MQLTTANMDDMFNEYALDLCGEYSRWGILKREKAFESRLQTYNRTAFTNFVAAKHYNPPIPCSCLNQINNASEFGTAGFNYFLLLSYCSNRRRS